MCLITAGPASLTPGCTSPCGGNSSRPSPSVNTTAVPTADVSWDGGGTGTSNGPSVERDAQRLTCNFPVRSAPTPRAVPVVNLPIVLDEHFVTPPQGWPDDADGVGWHADGVYHLAAREHEHFVALSAPLTGVLDDAVVSATFRKSGGPPGGGFGLIVRDQSPDLEMASLKTAGSL